MHEDLCVVFFFLPYLFLTGKNCPFQEYRFCTPFVGLQPLKNQSIKQTTEGHKSS